MYQHVRANLVSARFKTLASEWPTWRADGETVHIEYDGEYGSERVLIVSGRATVTPDNSNLPSFNVVRGDAVYFMHGFACTWHIEEAPLVQRYGYFGVDGKEIKETFLTCDVCGDDCFAESYLYDDEMDICPRCFKGIPPATQRKRGEGEREIRMAASWGRPQSLCHHSPFVARGG